MYWSIQFYLFTFFFKFIVRAFSEWFYLIFLSRRVEPSRATSLGQWSLSSSSSSSSCCSQVRLLFSNIFILIISNPVLTMMLMNYARYMSRGSHSQGFHNPPSLNHQQKVQRLQEQVSVGSLRRKISFELLQGQNTHTSAQSDML